MIPLNFDSLGRLGKKYNKDKYPIRWFNFGNIYFDYANSQSGYESKEALNSASLCYKYAKRIVSEKKFRHEHKSNYTFNFKDGMSKKDFENNIDIMYERVNIYMSLLKIDRLKDNNYKY